MNELGRPTRFERVHESPIIVWLKKWWFRIFQKYKEVWLAMTFSLLVVSTWLILPYVPFLMPGTFQVPVQANELEGIDGMVVVRPNRVAIGQNFQLRIRYEDALRQLEDVESVDIIIESELQEVKIEPAQVRFARGENIPLKVVELSIPAIADPPERLNLKFELRAGQLRAGQTWPAATLEVPIVGLPHYILQLVAFLGASGVLAANSLLPLLIKVGSYILRGKQDGRP